MLWIHFASKSSSYKEYYERFLLFHTTVNTLSILEVHSRCVCSRVPRSGHISYDVW